MITKNVALQKDNSYVSKYIVYLNAAIINIIIN